MPLQAMDLTLLENKFSSFNELEEAIRQFSNDNFVHLYIRDAKKLINAAHHCRASTSANESLKYYSIKYCCVNGGREFKKDQRSKNQRNTKTKKTGCNFNVQFLLTKDGKHLELSKCNSQHNHIIDEKVFRLHPHARKLPEAIKREVGELMRLRVNKKSLQARLLKETGQTVLLKDLYNIGSKFKNCTKNVDEVVEKLEHKYNCIVAILQENNVLKGIFFQDKIMGNTYKHYPEILFIDGTYKLTDIGFICFTFLIEDGNGNSEIVGVSLLAREDASSMKWLIEAFQSRNISWLKTRVIMTDKDLVERKILSDKFPGAKLLICAFQVLRTFKNEITANKMKITSEEAVSAKDLLTKICYASTEEEYLDLYEEFLNSVPMSVFDYYNKNWHPIYTEWTHISSKYGNFMNFTNNQVESFNARLKSIIQPHSSLLSFIEDFFIFLHSLRMERNSEDLSTEYMKKDDPAYPFLQKLLPYPFQFVKKQIDAANVVILKEKIPNNFTYAFKGRDYPVNWNFCSCMKFNAMRLPCKHIFSVRKKMGMSFYDSNLIESRWTRNYMTQHKKLFVKNVAESQELILTEIDLTELDLIEIPKVQKVKSRKEKFRILSHLASEIADIGSQSNGIQFDKKRKLLEDILRCWKSNSQADWTMVESIHTPNSDEEEPVPCGSMQSSIHYL